VDEPGGTGKRRAKALAEGKAGGGRNRRGGKVARGVFVPPNPLTGYVKPPAAFATAARPACPSRSAGFTRAAA